MTNKLFVILNLFQYLPILRTTPKDSVQFPRCEDAEHGTITAYDKNARFSMTTHKKAAFTMAEVLITLMIIGIIAMVTIPGLISSYKKHFVEVRLKSTYSMLNQMFLKGQIDGNYTNKEFINYSLSWSGGEQYLFDNYINKYLSISKNCTNVNTGICANVLKPMHKVNSTEVQGTPGGSSLSRRYILSNGTYLGYTFWGNYSQYMISVDIDGAAGNSEYGRDVFLFTYTSSGFGSTWGTCKDIYLYPGYSGGYSDNGWGCSTVIKVNGWKIPDNYPVKF